MLCEIVQQYDNGCSYDFATPRQTGGARGLSLPIESSLQLCCKVEDARAPNDEGGSRHLGPFLR